MNFLATVRCTDLNAPLAGIFARCFQNRVTRSVLESNSPEIADSSIRKTPSPQRSWKTHLHLGSI